MVSPQNSRYVSSCRQATQRRVSRLHLHVPASPTMLSHPNTRGAMEPDRRASRRCVAFSTLFPYHCYPPGSSSSHPVLDPSFLAGGGVLQSISSTWVLYRQTGEDRKNSLQWKEEKKKRKKKNWVADSRWVWLVLSCMRIGTISIRISHLCFLSSLISIQTNPATSSPRSAPRLGDHSTKLSTIIPQTIAFSVRPVWNATKPSGPVPHNQR